MRARIGDLAIIRFSVEDGESRERVGIITGCISARKNVPREYAFTYWHHTVGGRVEICYGSLPPHRLVRARPKGGYWVGSLCGLRRNNVELVK